MQKEKGKQLRSIQTQNLLITSHVLYRCATTNPILSMLKFLLLVSCKIVADQARNDQQTVFCCSAKKL